MGIEEKAYVLRWVSRYNRRTKIHAESYSTIPSDVKSVLRARSTPHWNTEKNYSWTTHEIVRPSDGAEVSTSSRERGNLRPLQQA